MGGEDGVFLVHNGKGFPTGFSDVVEAFEAWVSRCTRGTGPYRPLITPGGAVIELQ